MAVFTMNSKTVISIDFDRKTTCSQICNYCYVANTERMYKSYGPKILTNAEMAVANPTDFAATINDEYTKLKNSKAKALANLHKLPVRLYGSGDYIKQHFEFISKLTFNAYIISKNLTIADNHPEIQKLENLSNITSILLSFDLQNISNYAATLKYILANNITKAKFAFTGLPDDFNNIKKDKKFNIFFNISEKKIEKAKSRLFLEQCPCDSGAIKLENSCAKCSKCWRSAVQKNTK